MTTIDHSGVIEMDTHDTGRKLAKGVDNAIRLMFGLIAVVAILTVVIVALAAFILSQ